METTSDGAFFQVGSTGLRFADITDGLSHTLLVGEKHVNLGQFGTGWLDSSIYNGQYFAPAGRAAGPDFPLAQAFHLDGARSLVFGSYHPQVCQFAFCDGSVHALPVTIDPDLLGLLAARADGQPTPDF